MRTEDLLEAIGGVDDELLERSEKVKIKKDIPWKKWVSLAACVGLIVGGGRLLFDGLAMGSGVANDAASADDMSAESVTDFTDGNYGDAKCDGNLVVYPIAMAVGNEAIAVTRNISFEAKEEEGELWLQIEEGYVFTNMSEEEQVVQLVQSAEAYNSLGETELVIPANETKEMRLSQTHLYQEKIGVELITYEFAGVLANFIWDEGVVFVSDDINADAIGNTISLELAEDQYYYFEFVLE